MSKDSILKKAGERFDNLCRDVLNSIRKKNKEELLKMATEPVSDFYKLLKDGGMLHNEMGLEKVMFSFIIKTTNELLPLNSIIKMDFQGYLESKEYKQSCKPKSKGYKQSCKPINVQAYQMVS